MMDSDTHVLNPAWPTGITLCGRQAKADELVTVNPTCKGCRRILKSPPSRRARGRRRFADKGVRGLPLGENKGLCGPLRTSLSGAIGPKAGFGGREARLLESG